MGTTLDSIALTVTKWGEDVSILASEWDAWSASVAKRKIKVYNIIRTYVLDCIEFNVAWASSIANHFEATALTGLTVVFFSDSTLRPVSSANVYVKKVNYVLENLGTQNIRKVTLTLQEA